MKTEINKNYCSYSGEDISSNKDVPILIWETIIPKDKLKEELNYLKGLSFNLDLVHINEDLNQIHLETVITSWASANIEDKLHGRGWHHDED